MSNISRRSFIALGIPALTLRSSIHAQMNWPDRNKYPGVWRSDPPARCPLRASRSFRGLYFTGRHQEYSDADTWYPSWASDDIQYSPFADGSVRNASGVEIVSNCGAGFHSNTGYAQITGDDPLRLHVTALGVWPASGMPYGGRYPCANLVQNGVWYCGTYCCDINERKIGNTWYNWALLGPFLGCRYSKDNGKTWVESPCKPWSPLFKQDIDDKGPQVHELLYRKKSLGGAPGSDVGSRIEGLPRPKLGVMHFVDFGKNMQYSPDGKAYLVGHGSAPHHRHPRFGSVSWLSGNAIYITRVAASPETINDENHYEFFAGYDAMGSAIWTRKFSEMKPMLEWIDHLGSVTITYNPILGKYFMCIADGWPSTRMFSTILMESDYVAGPWRMVCYLKDFGTQGYFVNIPTKFIQADGKRFWLCYSANFTNGNAWHGPEYAADPPGSRYGLCLQEVKLL